MSLRSMPLARIGGTTSHDSQAQLHGTFSGYGFSPLPLSFQESPVSDLAPS